MPISRPKPAAQPPPAEPTGGPSADQPPKSGKILGDSRKPAKSTIDRADRSEIRPRAKSTTDPLEGLTFKRREFVRAYVGEAKGNATEAARRAGYRVPHPEGVQLLRKPTVQAAVQALVAERIMTSDKVLEELSKEANVDLGQYARLVGETDQAKIQAELARLSALGLTCTIRKLTPTRYGLGVEVCDRQGAKALLGKHHRLFTDRVEHSVGPPAIDSEAVRRALADPRALELACELDRLVSRPQEPTSPAMALEAPPRDDGPSDVDSYHPTTTDAPTGTPGPSEETDVTPTLDERSSGAGVHPPATTAVEHVAVGVGQPAPGVAHVLEGKPLSEGVDEMETVPPPGMAPFSG